MQFSRPEYWSGLPCPSPRDLPNPGIEARCPEMQADSLPSEPPDVDIANSSIPQRKTTFSLLSLFLKTSFVSSIWQLSPSVFLALMLTANFLSIDVTQIPDLLLPNPHICSLKIKALNIFSTFFLHLRPYFSFLFFLLEGKDPHLRVISPFRGHLPTSGDIHDCHCWGRSMPFTG